MDSLVGIRLRRNVHSAINLIKNDEIAVIRNSGGNGNKKARPKSMPQFMDVEGGVKGAPWWAALTPTLHRKKGKRGSAKALNSNVIEEETIVKKIAVRRFVLISSTVALV